MEKDNTGLSSLYSEALAHYQRGDLEKAISVHMSILERFRDDDTTCAWSCACIGDAYLTMRKLDLAEKYLRRALGYEPLRPQFHYLLGFTYSVRAQWAKAATELEISLKANPEDVESLRALGWVIWHSGDKRKGTDLLLRALSIDPVRVNALTDLSVISLKEGDYEAAQKYADRALKAYPNNPLVKKVYNAAHHFARTGTGYHPPAATKTSAICQIKVKIKVLKPPIWRRFLVPGNITFYKLHLVLQKVMGWSNYHLYEFRIRGANIGEPDPDYGREIKSARRVRLDQLWDGARFSFTYLYDFGDGWEHEVTVENVVESDEKLRHPVCTGGKRACPPEDCGGYPGYAELLKTIRNPAHEDYERMIEWLGDEFDPERFDMEEVNRRLKGLR